MAWESSKKCQILDIVAVHPKIIVKPSSLLNPKSKNEGITLTTQKYLKKIAGSWKLDCEQITDAAR